MLDSLVLDYVSVVAVLDFSGIGCSNVVALTEISVVIDVLYFCWK